jgi:hypothetical protein
MPPSSGIPNLRRVSARLYSKLFAAHLAVAFRAFSALLPFLRQAFCQMRQHSLHCRLPNTPCGHRVSLLLPIFFEENVADAFDLLWYNAVRLNVDGKVSGFELVFLGHYLVAENVE